MNENRQSVSHQQIESEAQCTGLKSLAQALDNLVADETSFLYLSLPADTVAEIQKNFTIGHPTGTADNAGSKSY